MAEACDSAASSSASLTPKEKPVVVRVKRKACQMPLDALLLEINERHPKRAILDLSKLSFTGVVSKEKIFLWHDISEDLTTRRVLVQHVETVGSSEATKDLLELCLANSSDSKEFEKKVEERKASFKKDRRQEQLHTTARQKHEELARSARFEQIWRSRRTEGETRDDILSEIYHLYDVVRIDEEEEHENEEDTEDAPIKDDAILCNYLPLIREYLPTAAEEIESDMNARGSTRDGYVYDIYTMESVPSAGAQAAAHYPLVQVNDEGLYDDEWGSDYETDDSNAENNPLNDYPDEETSEDGDGNGFLSDQEEEYEAEIVSASEEEDQEDGQGLRWGYR
ncbi:unnamed protein product [Spirodela intermedia]|uniref:Transcription factor Iwr1 domain-containing protein n=1 Tax=Spirodela intermedia TaxID=51605 RepID=A0A7I8JZ86_SPIIN|nr:unnamed protein product [Spirodela intermedia]